MIMLGAAAATYALRVLLITVVPARRLPPALRRGLGHLAPAALAALVATALVGHRGLGALVTLSPAHVGLAVAALVALRFRNPAVGVLAAVAVVLTWEVLT
ncbi:AzlD domain-containing protein [Actinomycetospora sp. C-140]